MIENEYSTSEIASKIFDLNFNKKKDPGYGLEPDIGSERNINPHNCLKTMLKSRTKDLYKNEKLFKILNSIDKNSIVLLSDNQIPKKTQMTHSGLIQYIYIAWAKELGVILSPDMLFFTIISEFQCEIFHNPETYRKLFTDSQTKKMIIINALTVDSLMSVLSNLAPNHELFDLVTKTTFSTAPAFFDKIMGITFADMASPFYEYCMTRCGIPKISIEGTREDWNKLSISIEKLQTILKNMSNKMDKYLETVIQTIKNIINATFVNPDIQFLKNIFNYRKNPICFSGHSPVVTKGWIRNFYLDTPGEISEYRSHLNCLAYNDKDDPENILYYYYASGLTSSYIVDGFLRPEYTIWHCQIIHPEANLIYDCIASN